MGSFSQHYPCDNMECDAWTVFTNRPAAGAMRGYGMPQASFADESNVDECAKAVGMDPLAFRMQNLMPKGFEDGFSHNVNYEDSFRQCLEVGKKYIDYDRKKAEFAKETGPIRHGIGVATFWYNTAVYPISLETSSNRMLLNLDGTRHHAVRRDGDRAGRRYRLCPDDRRRGGSGRLSQGPCGVLSGYRYHAYGSRVPTPPARRMWLASPSARRA